MEPDRQISKSEKIATVEEISSAIGKLTPAEWAKLHSFARNRARMMALRGSPFTEQDLVSEAVVALLEMGVPGAAVVPKVVGPSRVPPR